MGDLIQNLLSIFLHADSKYQSNLNEIDKFEHKSSLETLNKGFGWPTDNIGTNLGESLLLHNVLHFIYFSVCSTYSMQFVR